jgi:hypothetical protein
MGSDSSSPVCKLEEASDIRCKMETGLNPASAPFPIPSQDKIPKWQLQVTIIVALVMCLVNGWSSPYALLLPKPYSLAQRDT